MNDLERKLRDALTTAADLVEERNAGSLPSAPRRWPGFPGWLMPVFTAIVVLLLAVGVGLFLSPTEPEPVVKDPSPKFFLAVQSDDGPAALVVRDKDTGATLSRWKAPSKDVEFSRITGLGDGRSFFAVTQPTDADACGVMTFRIALSANGRIQNVSRDGWQGAPGWTANSIAISPDGARLAMALTSCDLDQKKITIVNLASGAVADYPSSGDELLTSLSWSASGRDLFFVGAPTTDGTDGLWKFPASSSAAAPLGDVASRVQVDLGGRALVSAAVLPGEQSAFLALASSKASGRGQCDDDPPEHEKDCAQGIEVSVAVVEVALDDGRPLRTLFEDSSADYDYTLKYNSSGGGLLAGTQKLVRFDEGVSTSLPEPAGELSDFSW